MFIQLTQGHERFGFANRIVQGKIGAQSVTVLHEYLSAKTQLGLFALGLAVKHALGVARALVRVITALFATKIDRRVAGVLVFGILDFLLISTVLAHETLETSPRLDERAVGSEVLITGPALLAREIINLGKEQLGDISREDPLVVLGKGAMIEAPFTELTIQEPQPEQIVAQLLTEQSLAAYAVESRQNPRFKQLLRRDARTSDLSIELVEKRREFLQYGVDPAFDGAQRMIGRHTSAKIDDGQKVGLSLKFSTHGDLIPCSHDSFKESL